MSTQAKAATFCRTGRCIGLLIDDDKDFGEVMVSAAKAMNIDLQHYLSIEDMGRIGQVGKYQFILCDFFLEDMYGNDIAEYIDALFCDIPLVMISAEKNIKKFEQDWPECVKGFVEKEARVDVVLQRVLVSLGLL